MFIDFFLIQEFFDGVGRYNFDFREFFIFWEMQIFLFKGIVRQVGKSGYFVVLSIVVLDVQGVERGWGRIRVKDLVEGRSDSGLKSEVQNIFFNIIVLFGEVYII